MEQVLVLFRAGTTSIRFVLGTYFVPELDQVYHTASKADKKTILKTTD